MSIDERSRMGIYRLMNRGIIAALGHPIKQGKESIVVDATAPDGTRLAVKVHTSRTFGGREKKQYVFGDWRFRHAKHHIAQRTDEIWAEKEYRNLARLHEAEIPAPRPVAFEKNVVVMTFVGEEGLAASQLNTIEGANFHRIARSTLNVIKKLVIDAEIVHGDLSAYNVLVWRNEPVLIDLSQAVLVTHPDASRLLQRDITGIAGFFSSKGVNIEDFQRLLEELQENIQDKLPETSGGELGGEYGLPF